MSAGRVGRTMGDEFSSQWGLNGSCFFRAFVLKIVPAAAALGIAGSAAAQTTPPDIPHVVSPLTVEPDRNGVNLTDGRITIDVPTLSVPGAPHLRFDRLQNAAPYIVGRLTSGESPAASYSVHTGGGSSESFQCAVDVCTSVTGTGSILNTVNSFVQAATGARYNFNNLHEHTTAPNETVLYYVSSIVYPNGETLTYSYDTATMTGDPIPGRVFYRPNTITSSLGYGISITYQGGDFNANTTAWSTPLVVTLYNSSAPSTPLGQLTYSADGGTITDLGGRVYHCTGCTNTLGNDLETAAGSTQLPTESAQATQVTPVSGANVVASVTRDGVAWTYAYANLRNPGTGAWIYDSITVSGPNGFHNVYATSGDGLQPTVVNSVTDSLSRTTSYAYDEAHRPVTVTYPEGNSVSVGYDAYGNINWRTMHAKSGSLLANVTETSSFPTDTCGSSGYPVLCYRPTWSRDGLARQTDFTYNTSGQLTEQLDPADANGVRRRTSIVYETSTGISRPSAMRICSDTGVSCSTSAPIQTVYDYTGRGASLLPASVSQYDPATGTTLTTTYTYDAAGRILSADGPLPGSDDATYNHYDVYGRKDWEIGAVEHPAELAPNSVRPARHFSYRDADDRPTRVETGYVTGPTTYDLIVKMQTDTTYDSRRYAIRATTSAAGTTYSVTDTANDDQGRLVCTATRMNPSSWSSMPGACALTATGNDGPDRITLNSYDAAGQLLQVTRAYGTSLQQNYATYTYSANGKRTSLTDANGNRAEMTWDGYDRQLRWIFPSPTTPGVANQSDYEEYGYDAVGNRTSLRKRDGSTLTYQYDNLNRVILKIVPERSGLSATHTRDVYYGYDLRNAQTYARFDSAAGEGVTNAYDGFGRLTSSTLLMDGVSRALAYQYDAAGNRTRITHPDGNWFGYAFDGGNRLQTFGANLDVGLGTFLYNSMGQVTSRGSGNWTSYWYDGVGRLQSLTEDLAGTAYDNVFQFSYNPAGQINGRIRSNDAYAWSGAYNVSRGYSVNGLNQYTAAGGASFGYDANGNLTSDGSNTYVYDVENRLVSASGGHNATLRYDPLGRLYEVVSPSAVTRFLYDGDALVAEYDGAGTQIARYVHGSNAAADDPLVWYQGATLSSATERLLKADHEGSIVALTDSSGNLTSINSYDEWGIPGAANQGRFQYTGQAWLAELGMYYYKARIYSPTLGRFMQTDPIGYADQFNLYSYVGNDPIDREDPTGNATIEPGCGSRLGDSASCSGQTLLGLFAEHEALGPWFFGGGGDPPSGGPRTANIPTTVPPNLPGGPYTPKPPTPGNRPGSFQGPPQPSGPRPQAQYVPPEPQGPPGSSGYWKVWMPGERGPRHFSLHGDPITPEQAHPNPQQQSGPVQQSVPIISSIIGALLYLVGIVGAPPAN